MPTPSWRCRPTLVTHAHHVTTRTRTVSGRYARLAVPLCILVLTVATRARAEDAPAPAPSPPPEEAASANAETTPSPDDASGSASADVSGAASADAPVVPPAVTAPVAPAALPPPAPLPRTEPLKPAVSPPAPARKSSSLRLPAFIALGVGGLGAGGAVLSHFATVTTYNDPRLNCPGRCEGAPRVALTAALTGAAVIGLGVGVALLVTAPKTEEPSPAPTVKFALNPRKAAATAVWRF
jgi:hypothetical protein